MERTRHHWKRLPNSVRKPLVFIIGALFIIAAGATGWLPGPGGIPLFLVGVAILATEFAWAARLRDIILANIKRVVGWYKRHKLIGTLILACLILAALAGMYATYRHWMA